MDHSYEAYCLDEAVVYFGLSLENKLDEAGDKPSKEAKKAKAARDRVLDSIFKPDKNRDSSYADPASMFL